MNEALIQYFFLEYQATGNTVYMLTAAVLVRLVALNRLRSDCKGYFVCQHRHLSPISPLRLLIDLVTSAWHQGV